MNLGKKIVEVRKNNNLSQEDFAEIFNVSRQTVSSWENNKSYPDIATIIKISDEFNISLDILLKEDSKLISVIDKKIKGSKLKNLCLVVMLILVFTSCIFLVVSFDRYYQRYGLKISAPKLFKANLKEQLFEKKLYYELGDRYIFLYDLEKIDFTLGNKRQELKTWFKEDKNFLNTFVNALIINNDEVITYKDGGSKEYSDGYIRVIVCNTLDGNKNILIGKDLTYEHQGCLYDKKVLVSQKSQNDKVVNILDKMSYLKTFHCNAMLVYFYEDESYKYTWGCPGRAQTVIVQYESGFEETFEQALKTGSVQISDLDKYNIFYEKEKV